MIQKQNDQQCVLNQSQQHLRNHQIITSAKDDAKVSRIPQFFYQLVGKLIFCALVIVVIAYSLLHIYGWAQPQQISQAEDHLVMDNVTVMQLSQSEMKSIISKMSTRPIAKIKNDSDKEYKKLKPTPEAYFAYRLKEQPNNPEYVSAERYYYEKKYSINKYGTNQLPLCIVSSGRNVVYQNRYQRYLRSLQRQEYDNYKVIIVDDHSSDGSVQAIQQSLESSAMAQLKDRVSIIRNQKRLFALYSRDIAITNYCSSEDIIVELDTDDQFIGRQVLKTINAVYSENPQIWVMYSSYIHWSPNYAEPTEGISQKIPTKILQQGTYRLTTQWFTSATRTFRKKIYAKIDKSDFIDWKGNFYKWTSDLFMSGYQHYKYIHEVFYYYNLNHNKYNATEKAIARIDALSIRRYKLLENLDQHPQRIEEVQNIEWLKQEKKRLEGILAQENSQLNWSQ